MPENPYESPEETGAAAGPVGKRHVVTVALGLVLLVLGLPLLIMGLVANVLFLFGFADYRQAPLVGLVIALVIGAGTVTYGLLLINRRH